MHRREATTLQKLVAERTHASASIQHECRVVRQTHLYTRRVTAVAHRVRARCRDRPANAVEGDLHQEPALYQHPHPARKVPRKADERTLGWARPRATPKNSARPGDAKKQRGA